MVASIKSLDLGSLRAMDLDSFEQLVSGYMRKVSEYQGDTIYKIAGGRRATEQLSRSDIAARELTLAVSGTLSNRQSAILTKIQQNASRWVNPVNLRVVTYGN